VSAAQLTFDRVGWEEPFTARSSPDHSTPGRRRPELDGRLLMIAIRGKNLESHCGFLPRTAIIVARLCPA
jgi:hypothetical protein